MPAKLRLSLAVQFARQEAIVTAVKNDPVLGPDVATRLEAAYQENDGMFVGLTREQLGKIRVHAARLGGKLPGPG